MSFLRLSPSGELFVVGMNIGHKKIKCHTFLETSAHVDFKSDDNNKEDEDNKDKNIKGYKNILLRL